MLLQMRQPLRHSANLVRDLVDLGYSLTHLSNLIDDPDVLIAIARAILGDLEDIADIGLDA